MKIKDGFVLREIADSIMVLPTGKLINEFKGTITLNETGKFIWELMQEDISMEDIIHKMMENYKIDEGRARQGVEKFINSLRQVNIIEE